MTNMRLSEFLPNRAVATVQDSCKLYGAGQPMNAVRTALDTDSSRRLLVGQTKDNNLEA